MKQISQLSIMAVIISTMTFAGCADDVYDPEKGIQTEPKENPLGEDFSAPDGFDWSMINAVKLNVEVKDELNGSYEYLIEVFTDNPLSNENAVPIAAGVANKNKNYTAEVNLSKAIQNVYIRQTDPKQRKEIYTFNVPENGGALDCKLYYEGVTSRAAMRAVTSNSNSAFEAAKAAGITEIADKNYTEEEVIPSVPAQSDDFVNQWNKGLLANGAKFIIGKEYTDKKPFTELLRTNSGRATVFVKGVWKLSDWSSLPSSLDVYIMDGGKIIGDNLTFEAGGSLTVAHGGSLECTANLNLGCPTKVFGSITANDIKMNSGQSPELFNKGAITATNEIFINGSNVINHHTLKANSFNFVDSRVLNKANIEAETSIMLNNSKIFNYSTIKFNIQNGLLNTNNAIETAVVNHNEATVTGYHINCGMSLYNDGLIEVSKCTNNSVDIIYNSCTMIIKEAFTFRNLTLNKGSITAGRSNPTDTEWLSVPTVTSLNDATLTLIDGSMIKAGKFEVNSGLVTFTAKNSTNDSKSMIKAEEIIHFSVPNTVSLLGNLVIEGEITGTSQWNQFAKNESVNTGFDESKYTIETCGGIFNEGNEGEAPSNPEPPEVVEDADIYTFAFEDNWPVYGDFDMNDLVLTLTKKKLKINKSGNVENLSMFIEIRAVGANKNLGVGIRFVKLPKGLRPDKFDVNKADAVFEEGQEAPTFLLTTNAHNMLWTDEYTGQERRINTIIDGPTQKNPHKLNINMDIPTSANVKPEDLNINNIDIFIITAPASQKGKRTEVHVAGFAPTELGGTHYLGSGNDNSSTKESKYYLSKENLAWAIVVPQEFAWPQEVKKITDVYNLFESWIVSGGQNNKDWYKSHNENIYPIDDLTPVN